MTETSERTPGRRRAIALAATLTLIALGGIGVGLFELVEWLRSPPQAVGEGTASRPEQEQRRRAPLERLASVLEIVTGRDEPEEPSGVPDDHPFARTRITGRVIDSDTEQGIAGAQVRVRPTYGDPKLGRAGGDGSVVFTTRPDGTYAMKGIPPGSFDVEVRAPGYMPGQFGFKKFSELEDDEGFDFALHPATGLEGRVINESGAPVQGARIAAVPPDMSVLTEATPVAESDEDGRFELEHIDGRGTTLLVTHREYETEILDLPPAGDEAAPSTDVQVTLRRGRVITGVVRDKHGPIRGARVSPEILYSQYESLHVTPATKWLSAVTDAEGRYSLPAIGQGRVGLQAEASGYRRARARVLLETRAADGDREVHADFELEPGSVLRGRVVTAERRPAPLARVIVSAEGGAYATAETDRDGAFAIDGLPPNGPMTVMIRHHAHPPLIVHDADPAVAREYQLDAEGRILGRVIDARTGAPIPRYQYTVAGPLRLRNGAVSISGALEIDQLVAGTYTITMEADGYQPAEVSGIVVSRGSTASGIQFLMKRGGAVAGRVRGDASTGGVLVQALIDGGRVVNGAVVDGDGRFVLPNLPDGNYVLRAIGEDVIGEIAGVQVQDGATRADVEIPLRRRDTGDL